MKTRIIAPVDMDRAPAYFWGAGCRAWRLLDDPGLSVHLEEVPPGGAETPHLHRRAQQFFYLLAGRATLELEEGEIALTAGQGLHVPAGATHRFRNAGEETVRFLVISSPTTRGDRVEAGA